MLRLPPDLLRQLERWGVDLEELGTDLLVLRGLPVDPDSFNKPRTNLLIRWTGPGLPCLVGVDADLVYAGDDPATARLFAGAQRRKGWLLFPLSGDSCSAVAQQALGLLGSPAGPGGAPRRPTGAKLSTQSDSLETLGTNLSRLARQGLDQPTVGRDSEIERVCASLLGWRPRLPLIVGESGVGKTNLLHAVARKLAELRPELEVIRVNLSLAMAGIMFDCERENVLGSMLTEASEMPNRVLALEHFEHAVAGLARGAALLAESVDQGLLLVGTILPEFVKPVSAPPLARHLDLIELAPLDPSAALEVLRLRAPEIARRHSLGADPKLLEAAVERSLTLAGPLPQKALALLDAAMTRAALAGARQLDLYHIYSAAVDFPEA